MSTSMTAAMSKVRADLRHLPTEKRIRAVVDDQVVVDSTKALLVWEPRRVSPEYAVPAKDVSADLVSRGPVAPGGGDLLHPGVPFTVHSTPGESFSVSTGARTLEDAAFRPADPRLGAYVVLDFKAFDRWLEEDEPVRGHPRDPYHRVDTRASSRHLRVEHEGKLLAETHRPVLVFETSLPTRFYLPREDVVAEMVPSDKTSYCPYKGEASYWSVAGLDDVAWAYLRPLSDATQLAGLVAFYDDLLDLTLDGQSRRRTDTEASRALLDEFDM